MTNSQPAQPISNVLQRLRSSYAANPQAGLAQLSRAKAAPQSPQNSAPAQSQTQSLQSTPLKTPPAQQAATPDQDQQLNTLDEILTQLESQKSAPVFQPSQTPVQPVAVQSQSVSSPASVASAPKVPSQENLASPLAPGAATSPAPAQITSAQTAQPAQNSLPQAVPQAVDALSQQHQPTSPSTFKESGPISGLDQPSIEAGSVQYVEQERSPELPVEVEGFLEHVEQHQNLAPQEIVVAEPQATDTSTNYPKQSVVVLPITPEIEEVGAKKSPRDSVRWLVEWSRKLMKKFVGTVIYRQAT